MSGRNIIRTLRADRGVAAVEFAFVVPILCMLLFAIAEFGIAFNKYLTVTDAARVSARVAVVNSPSDACPRAETAANASAGSLEIGFGCVPVEIAGQPSYSITVTTLYSIRIPFVPVEILRRNALEHCHGEDGVTMNLTTRLASERGQVLVFTAFAMIVLLGFVALVIDVGAYYHAQRDLQKGADAAALAGAQDLPLTSNASGTATSYADVNVTGSTKTITFPTDAKTGSLAIHVKLDRDMDSYFARVLGIDSFHPAAEAQAAAPALYGAGGVAPIALSDQNEAIKCFLATQNPSCYSTGELSFTLSTQKNPDGGGGAFQLLNLNPSCSPNASTPELEYWIQHGTKDILYPGVFCSSPGAPLKPLEDEMASRFGDEILIPVYSGNVTYSGSPAEYQIIGFIGFTLTGFDPHGNEATMTGTFTRVVWNTGDVTGGTGVDLGARMVSLTG